MTFPLIAVAHGSRDRRSAATMHAVIAGVRAARPDLDVRLAFLDLNAPSVESVVASVAADGHRHAIVVPLLLGSAFHARVDLPGLLAEAQCRHPRLALSQADVLGTDVRLIDALHDRILATGADPADERIGIAVAAVGSSSADANRRTETVVDALRTRTNCPVELCFATREPSIAATDASLRRRGADRIVVAPWFLASGTLTDRLRRATPNAIHAAPLGSHTALTDVVLSRYVDANTVARAA